MKKLLIPLILGLFGTGGGVAAGMFLFPPAAPEDDHPPGPCGDLPAADHDAQAGPTEEDILAAAADGGESVNPGYEYAKLANQFIVPVVEEGGVVAMVLLTMSLEVPAGETARAFEVEPRLRDAFLRVLFDHANAGGFDGVFTDAGRMRALRDALRQAATSAVPDLVNDVLILEIQRQDV